MRNATSPGTNLGPVPKTPTSDSFLIVQRKGHGHDHYYVPMIVRDRAIEFKYHSDAAMFLRRLTGNAGQLTWEENLHPDKSSLYSGTSEEPSNPTIYAIRPIRQYATIEEAMSDYDYRERQDALRRLTPKERALLKLPDPDPPTPK